MNAKNYFSRKSYNQKDWLSSNSYKQAMSKHFNNAKPYLTETAVAVGVVVIGAVACYDWFHHPKGDLGYRESKWQKTSNKIRYANNDTHYRPKSRLSFDQVVFLYGYEHTKHLVAPTLLAPIANAGIQICKVAWDEGGFSFGCILTGGYKALQHIGNAWHGSKEIAYGIGNLAGCCGTALLVDGIYDHVVMPYMGDILHIH